jgi:serine protease Do
MKQFGQLLLAAVMGSALTFTAYRWSGKDEAGVKIEHINGSPTSSVAYTVNDKGQFEPLDFTATAEKVTAAVVHIRSTTEGRVMPQEEPSDDPLQFFFGPRQFDRGGPQQSSGSGVIINENGYIVTNNHVVQNADVLDVTLSDDRTYKGEVIGIDPDTDIAVIKINEKELPHLSFVNSDESKVGEWVLAVGNPFNLNSTVTAGIISAKGRNIGIIGSDRRDPSGNRDRTAIESFIQTDAAINPGNSGGALVNLSGGLLGINTAIASNTGSYNGYGFAVPANIVSKVVTDLIAYGAVQRGWLGIQVQSVSNELVKEHDLSVSAGAYVSGFGNFEDKSAAKSAGIKNGDVVVKLDDYAIRSSTALVEYVGTKHPGDKINVTVNRQGKTLVIPVTLKTRDGNVGLVKREEVSVAGSLGMQLEDLDQATLKKLDLSAGVRVTALENGKVARLTDMRKGFIITRVDDSVIKSSKEVNEILKKKKAGDLITISGVYEGYTREFIYAVRI